VDLDALMNEGREALANCDWEAAEAAAQTMLDAHYSGGFEILALAEKGRGNAARAIEVLEQGIREAPSVWLLWNLLGNCYSDESNYARAYECYRAALECPKADADYVNLNYAIALQREGKHEFALQFLDRVHGEKLAPEAAGARMRSFIEQRRYQEAFELGYGFLDLEPNANTLSHIICLMAEALWKNGDRNALDFCWKAVEANPSNQDAMWLIREIEGRYSPRARGFRLVLRGQAELPFYVNYTVVADDEAEALRLAARFEDKAIRRSLRIEEAKPLEIEGDAPKGVYWRSGTVDYREEES
jgi:tetratricopeptide (TPR) repeat protein